MEDRSANAIPTDEITRIAGGSRASKSTVLDFVDIGWITLTCKLSYHETIYIRTLPLL
jgi:hypothetical protein